MDIIADRPINTTINGSKLIICPLGAGQEVGRSCIYMSFKGKVVLFDCGILPSASGRGSLPFLDLISDDNVDLVLISHFHLDHCGSLPVLSEREFFHPFGKDNKRTRVLMTIPTKEIMNNLLHDFLSISSTGDESDNAFTIEQLNDCLRSIETINYHENRWHNGIKVTCYQAGHVLGAAMFCVEIDSIRILYTGDFSREEDRHLPAAEIPPFHPNVVICESTYGNTNHAPRKERESDLTVRVATTIRNGGKVLIPVFALGRTQELLLLLNEYWSSHVETSNKGKLFYLSTLAAASMNLFKKSINMMNSTIRNIENPFALPFVEMPDVETFFSKRLVDMPPCVIICSPAMMENGISRKVLEEIAYSENSLIVLTGYCMANTVARQIKENNRTIPKFNSTGNETIEVKCDVVTISFSAHSDYKGTFSFIRDTQPERVVLVHGETSNMFSLRDTLNKDLSDRVNAGLIQIFTPKNQEQLKFIYNPPKTVEFISQLKETDVKEGDTIEGVMVERDFKYQIINVEDMYTFTQLSVCNIVYREHFKTSMKLSMMIKLLSMVCHTVEIMENKTDLKANGLLTIRLKEEKNGVFEYILEWAGNYEADLLANSIIMLIMQEEANLLSPFKSDNAFEESATTLPAVTDGVSDTISIMKDIIKEEYGDIKEENQGWRVDLPNGLSFTIDPASWEVHCDNSNLCNSVKETIRMVLEFDK